MERSIYQQAIDSLPPEDISNHESDLYLAVSKESAKLIANYGLKQNVTVFFGNDKRNWFDIPFAYLPYWSKLNESTSASI